MHNDTETSRFVGRERELAVLSGAVASMDGGPAVLEIAGEPGIGKTRLLAEFTTLARRSGATVVTGTDEDGKPRDLREFLHTDIDRTVLVIDDVHLADPTWAETLDQLRRRPPRAPVLLVLAHRPRQTGAELRAALGAAHDGWPVTRLVLDGLAPTEIDALCEGRLHGEHRVRAHDDSGGNPRYLDVMAAGSQGPQAVAAAALPLLMETVRLPAPTRLVAHAAAVAGDPFEPGLLASVAELGQPSVLSAIDELLAADLLRPASAPGHFVFRHPVVRRSVYAAIPAAWRLGAHGRAAAVLRDRDQPEVRFAEHVERASQIGDEEAVTVLVDAAAATEAQNPATAADWYHSALRLMPDTTANRARRRTLLAATARTSGMAGRLRDCRSALTEHGPLVLAGPDTTAAGVAVWAAKLALFSGDYTTARETLRASITELTRHDPTTEHTSLRLALACTAVWDGSQAQTAEWAEEAVLAAAGSDDEILRAHALSVHATARIAGGAAGNARRSAVAAAELADRQSDTDLAGGLEMLGTLGWLETHLEQYPAAIGHFERGVAVARATGQWLAMVPLVVGLGTVSLRRGDHARAREHAELAVRLSGADGREDLRAMALWLRAQTALAMDDTEAALADSEAASLATADNSPWWRQARMVHAAARLAAGDAQGCLDTLAAAGLADLTLANLPAWNKLALAELLCEAEMPSGSRENALAVAAQARTVASGLGLPGQLAAAELIAARVSEAALETFVQALEAVKFATTSGHLTVVCRAHLTAVRALVTLGDPDRARQHLDLAGELADQTGSPALVTAVTAARTELDTPVPSSGFMLSQREFEIATLVSEGKTNRQIARLLEVSHKTVETHLSRIFAKLDVSSRAEIANLIGRSSVVARPKRPAKVPA
jgi:DNA-binding NarL/FixJ family response regulator